MASVDYTGRAVDLFIFKGSTPAGEAEITLSWDGDEGGFVTTGIQKLVQSFLLLFITERGSVPHKENIGTGFVTSLRQGQILDEGDVNSEFIVASELVQQTLDLVADENDFPEDEQFESAELLRFVIDRASSLLRMTIRITSVAGESRTVFCPVPLAIR